MMRTGSGLDFLADGMAHDIKNILQVITGSASMALEFAEGNEEQRREIGKILEVTDRGARLLRKLLNLGREPRVESAPLNLNRLVRELMELFGPVFAKKVSYQLKLETSLDTVFADSDAVEHVLLNLLINATDAMPGGGTLTIETRGPHSQDPDDPMSISSSSHPYVRLIVRDTGEGMEPEVLEQIFEPYYTTKVLAQGSGLGLSMARSLVERMGGFIHAESTPGHGTKMHVMLPVFNEADMI